VNQGRGQGFTVFGPGSGIFHAAFLVAVSTLWRPPHLAAAKPKNSRNQRRDSACAGGLSCGFAQPTAQDGLGKTGSPTGKPENNNFFSAA
jgi:hypothetical protein